MLVCACRCIFCWQSLLLQLLPVAVERYNLTKKIASHVRPGQRCRPPPGGCLHRQRLSSTKKDLAGRYYQFLSGHGSFGSYLKTMKKVDSDWCWFCSIGERQSRFRPVTRFPARHESYGRGFGGCATREVQRSRQWGMFGDSRATPAVLSFLMDTRVERMVSLAPRGGGVCNLVFPSRYMRPEGPWQRLRRCPRAPAVAVFIYMTFSLAPVPA